jgi:ArsR family transcriptional regulator
LQALTFVDQLCVCDLAASLGMSESAVSHQLRLLRTSRLVTRRRVGRVAYYSLTDEHVRHLLRDGIRHAAEEPAMRGEVPA